MDPQRPSDPVGCVPDEAVGCAPDAPPPCVQRQRASPNKLPRKRNRKHRHQEQTGQTLRPRNPPKPAQGSVIAIPDRRKRNDREILNGNRSACIWFTGLPSSGKSSIAREVEYILYIRRIRTYVLDGDNVRHGLNSNLGFSPEDRRENIMSWRYDMCIRKYLLIIMTLAIMMTYAQQNYFVASSNSADARCAKRLNPILMQQPGNKSCCLICSVGGITPDARHCQ